MSAGVPAAPGARTDVRFALLLTLAFATLVAIGMGAHEIWRDEWQAWLLARDSGSIPELLYNARYEGHPAAWHILLFGVSRITRDVAAMQALHLALATGAIWILARHGPFTRLEKVLIAFGYFTAYEYAVISRSYALGTLALFGACAAWSLRRRTWLPFALWLALLCQTSIYGVILALACGAAVLAEWVFDADARAALRTHARPAALGALIVAASMASAVGQARPPGDAAFTGRPATARAENGSLAARSVALIPARALLPFPRIEDGVPSWGETALVEDPGVPNAALIGIAILIGLALFVARSPAALALLGAGTAGMLTFAMVFHYGYLRHQGQLLLVVVAAYWIALLPGTRTLPSPLSDTAWQRVAHAARRLFVAVLCVHVSAFAVLWAADLRLPFSEGRSAARTIAAADDGSAALAATNTAFAVTLAGYLDRPIHYLDEHTTGTFVVWGTGRTRTPEDSIIPIAGRLLGDPDAGQVLLATEHAVPPATIPFLRVEALPRDPRRHLTNERFFLYRITRR